MAVGRLQILPHGNHFNAVFAHIAHDFAHFVVGFAQAHHNAGFGGDVRHHFAVAAQQFQRMFVVRAGACLFVEARVGFQIVVHHIGRVFRQDFQRDVEPAAEIGHEDFNFGVGAGFADFVDAVGKMLCAAVAQVVPVHGGDDDVFQLHGGHGFGQVFRLVFIQLVGAAVPHVAEGAAAGADVAHNHEGGGTVAEAFADVGARGFFAHGVHFLAAQNIFDFKEFLAAGDFGAYPAGFFQFFFQRYDFDGDACGFAGAFVFYAFGVV